MHAVRAGAAVADGVEAQLPARGLHGHVHLAGRDPEALGDQLEVVDERFHRGAHDLLDVVQGLAQTVAAQRELRRPGDLGVGHHDRLVLERLELVQGLLDDLDGLVHLLLADQEAAPAVGIGVRRHLEVVVLVAAVRLGLAQVPGQARRPEHRTGHAEGDAALHVQVSDLLGAGLPDRAAGEQVVDAGEAPGQDLAQLADLLRRSGRQVLSDATGSYERVVHPQAGDHLEDVEDHLALAERVGHGGQRTELEAAGGEGDQVAGDPVQLHAQHPDGLGARRCLDAQQLLHREGVAGLVEDRRQVVHAGHEGDALDPVAVLQVLLDAGVQVADDGPRRRDCLALELHDEPQHAVRRRVLRAHVDHDALFVHRPGQHAVPVAAGDGVDGALGRVAGACGVRVGREVAVGRGAGRGGHAYALRSSGGGICAPLYSTGTPPSG